MSDPDFTRDDVRTWLARRPGTFEQDSERRCWRAAWEHFNDAHYPVGHDVEFMMIVEDLGFGVRPTALGGFILDKVT